MNIIKMKRPYLLLALLCLVACGPSKYIMDVEMRHPSKADVDLAGKLVSIVYLEDGRQENADFAENMAKGFASSLEKDYCMEKGSIGVYRKPLGNGENYACRDSMFNILMDTGADVVFLIDTIKLGTMTVGSPAKVSVKSVADSSYVSTGSIPFVMKLYCYDGMDKADRVRSFSGSSVAVPDVYSDGKRSREEMKVKAFEALGQEAAGSGQTLASSFISQWKVEQFTIMYFDNDMWFEALECALQFKWSKAIDLWLKALQSNDPLKRSCAAYNIATACHIMGNDSLAGEWLDFSDKENHISASDTLRKRLSL